MRLHVLSDLHLEFASFEPPDVEADVTVLAGDIHVGIKGVEWAATRFRRRPVIYVMGNHELYGHAVPGMLRRLVARGADLGVHVLLNDTYSLDGVRFLGATLWTDFAVLGDPAAGEVAARQSLLDYRRIRVEPTHRKLEPRDTLLWHAASVRWLRDALAQSSDVPTVIVTHHAPSARSLNPRYADPVAASYASALDALVAGSGARLWIHGHTHHSVDYRLGSTRVVSNQRGYPAEDAPGFDPALVLDV